MGWRSISRCVVVGVTLLSMGGCREILVQLEFPDTGVVHHHHGLDLAVVPTAPREACDPEPILSDIAANRGVLAEISLMGEFTDAGGLGELPPGDYWLLGETYDEFCFVTLSSCTAFNVPEHEAVVLTLRRPLEQRVARHCSGGGTVTPEDVLGQVGEAGSGDVSGADQ